MSEKEDVLREIKKQVCCDPVDSNPIIFPEPGLYRVKVDNEGKTEVLHKYDENDDDDDMTIEHIEKLQKLISNSGEYEMFWYEEIINILHSYLDSDEKALYLFSKLQEYTLFYDVLRLTKDTKEFYLKMDEAHGFKHIINVLYRSFKMCEFRNISDRETWLNVCIAVFYHDIFSNKDRKNHHILASEYVIGKQDYLIEAHGIEEHMIVDISEAIIAHRASSVKNIKLEPCAEILRYADKDEPELGIILDRIVESLSHPGNFINNTNTKVFSEEDSENVICTKITKASYDHLMDKFSRDGYFSIEGLYLEFYGSNLIEKLYEDIDSVDIKYIFNKVKEYRRRMYANRSDG
jgi:hypothetical protein